MSSTWWGSSSHVRARYSWPPSAKWPKKKGVVEVDLLWFLEAQILRPGPVVERLGDDVARSAVTLEFEDVDASLGIEGEEVDESPEPGGYLPGDDEQIGSAHAGILGDHVLEALLGVQRRRHQRVRPVVGHPPDRHFDSHRPSFRSSP